MKKIAIIIPSLKFGGGAEKSATMVGNNLYEKGYNIHYLTFYDVKEKYPFKGKYNTLNERLSSNIIINVYKLFKRSYEIKKYCKKYNINTCISFMEEANFSTILSKLFGNRSRIIISIRYSLVDYGKGIYFFLVKLLYKFTHKIIVLTNFEKNNLISNFGIKKDKIEIIYNTINIKKIDNLKNEDLGEYKNLFNNGKFTFINIGRLTRIKNQELLIKTFIEFNNKYNNTQLIILGEGELKKELENLIGDKKNIHLLGNQNNVYKFLYNSDCFILTSFSESFGNVIIESMACGLPIITSKTQGSIEIVGDNKYGFILLDNSKGKLFEAMKKIYLKKDLREKYQRNSLERAKDFDIKKILEKWEKEIIST